MTSNRDTDIDNNKKFKVENELQHSRLPISNDVFSNEVANFFDAKMTHAMAETSQKAKQLLTKTLKYHELLTKLLKHVAHGEQEQAEAILESVQNNPRLLKALLQGKVEVIDKSNRKFSQHTAFQLALWGLDRHMWRMLMKYFGKLSQYEIDGELEAFKQMQELEEGKLTYEVPIFNPKAESKEVKFETQSAKHFDFQPLIDASNDYNNRETLNNQQPWWCVNRKPAMEVLVTGVGGAQRFAPVHVANEYCHPDRSFYPTPSFEEDHLPRKLTTCHGDFYSDQLGVKYAIFRENTPKCWRVTRESILHGCPWDALAMAKLQKVRTKEYDELKEYLYRKYATEPQKEVVVSAFNLTA